MRLTLFLYKGMLYTILFFTALSAAAYGSELGPEIIDSGMEIGDRLRIKSKIMSVDPSNQTMTIAEKEVRLLDATFSAQHLRTTLLDAEGKPVAFNSFQVGQLVLVIGYIDPEGHVFAKSIQKTDANSAAGASAKKWRPQVFKLAKPQNQGTAN